MENPTYYSNEDGGEEEINTLGEYIGERNNLKQRHGKGWAYLPNNDIYQGHYRCGLRHGNGLYVFKNGARYLGNWLCGLKSGMGIFYSIDGSKYLGEWKKDLKHGHGIYTYPNGDTYEGSWYKNKRHGVGTYKFKELECSFLGTWKDGVRNGPAEIISEKIRFHGIWHNLLPKGPGAFVFSLKMMELGNVINKTINVGDNTIIDNEILEIPIWRSQNIHLYDFERLPPESVPLPLSDSASDDCMLSHGDSESDIISFLSTVEEEEEEEEGDGSQIVEERINEEQEEEDKEVKTTEN